MKKVPVVMCAFNRPERFGRTLEELEAQQNVKPILYVWNNNPEIAEQLESIASTSTLEIHFYHSDKNIGGFGRFYQAKKLADIYPSIVMIDDDVSIGPSALETLILEHTPQTIRSFFAFKLINATNYFDRIEGNDGGEVDYCGTGGTIVDSTIFTQDILYECPQQYWYIEDLWLSYVASHVLGWKLLKSGVDMHLDEGDYKDQWLTLKEKKSIFLQYLIEKGWKITANQI